VVVTRRSVAFACLWLLLGLGLGRILPRAWFRSSESGAPEEQVWREAGVRAGEQPAAPTAALAPASLADLVDRVKAGVCQVLADRGAEPEAAAAGAAPVGDVVQIGATGKDGHLRATGFVISRNGYVVTNYHAICGARRVRVSLAGHRMSDAEIVDWDPVSDIALLRMRSSWTDLTPLALGDSDRVRTGDWVLILGNPFDYTLSAQHGIVSHPGRHLMEVNERLSTRYLQFAAPVYPGNSGGPLFDMSGNVIGVISRSSTLGHGISFALPTNALKRVLDGFRAENQGDRGWVGLRFRPADLQRVKLQLPTATEAVEVCGTVDDSPASTAGIRNGDLILRFNGQDVRDAQELHDWITGSRPGSEVALGLFRPGVDAEREVRFTVSSVRTRFPSLDKLN
jgi:S1-C subfamily serine protease